MFWNTVNDDLRYSLMKLMGASELAEFRLVGGTALSLQLGHRISIDIDLFTDAPYRSVNFDSIDHFLKNTFEYIESDFGVNPGLGKSYLIGREACKMIKLDLYYAMDPFFRPAVVSEGIRMASLEEIIAMKVDIVQRGGRKKDFWDLHELLERYTISEMIELHRQRSEWTHDESLILQNFTDFQTADTDFDPICLRGKQWLFIKDDFGLALSGDH
ncbi:nucleotidyl transferase AbiEii/AbiGii toxin family protein [Pedobacter sp. SYP-B3415]|uniref:nucleotidyl transferase AbiEii/AbiGii toxin family protein n=1 Tax=Pedobacter sp. SYP-B3415 TaxID=2496641 RepID=UPI00101E16FF|nr:nucleotidyl transferase AbiEii/AbiGii toxin family protein [Pedobacter sp. SYP-B3415]